MVYVIKTPYDPTHPSLPGCAASLLAFAVACGVLNIDDANAERPRWRERQRLRVWRRCSSHSAIEAAV